MADWMKVGTNVVTGGVAGTVDQLVQNYDEKKAVTYKAANAGKAPSMWSQMGTYLNFGVPLAVVVGVGTNVIKPGEWADRLATVSGQLAGRKMTHRLTTQNPTGFPASPAPYTEWARAEAARARAAAESAAERTYQPEFDQAGAFAF